MAKALVPPYPEDGKVRERICLMGGPGTGKTRAWLSIADYFRKTHKDARFFVIDTDDGVGRMLMAFPRLADSGTLAEVVVPIDFDDYLKTIKRFQKDLEPTDWLVVDLMHNAWEEVQNDYSEKIHGQTKGDYFLAMRKMMKESAKNFQPFEGWTDWPTIKARYQDFANRVFLRHRSHVLVCTGIRSLQRQGQIADSKDIIDTFGHLGVRPEGEKRMSHLVHTVLLMQQRGDDEWRIRTGKDREREIVNGLTLGSEEGQFVRRYLMDVAGWHLG